MQLTVKTLKGDKFAVEASESDTVAQVKTIIERTKSDLPAESMKLIHSGKVLKDEDTIGSCQIKANDFLVVMITKAKKPTATTTAAATATTSETTSAVAPTADPVSTPTIAITATAETTQPATTPIASSTTTAVSSSASSTANEFPIEIVANLTSMGFPEPEVLACLRASRGNPDLAVEFLMNGIPPAFTGSATTAPLSSSTSAPTAVSISSTTARPLDALRNHPQINQLRTLIQSNPQMLPSVLSQIAQQQPELLQEINSNQADFLAIMNEPVTSSTTMSSLSSSTSINPVVAAADSGVGGGVGGTNLTDPLRDLNPAQLQALAAAMGVTPDQLNAAAQFLSNLPPHEMANLMRMHEGMDMDDDDLPFDADGDINAPGIAGGGGVGGGEAGRARTQVISLTADEMAAVQRLTELGFDRNLCVQAFLACDKNEALAANLLMDGGFGFDDFNNSSNQQNHPDDDEMYD